MGSASRPCRACGRPTDRYQELCVHCQRGRSAVSPGRPPIDVSSRMSAMAIAVDLDDNDGWDDDSRTVMVAD
jgi:hypothetical protein